ncbi:MAG: NUDIX domain-containing protein [Anaerolineae bacterium]|nr:NUDIX domain-containing protein [Anaerolineae bacterium]
MDKIICQTPFLALMESEAGVGYVKAADGALIVPMTDAGEVLFIREYSPAYKRPFLTLPGGIIEPGEGEAEAANREMQEEIGLRADNILYLGEVYRNFKYIHAKSYAFLARDLSESKLVGDEEDVIEVVPLPLTALDRLIQSGELQDAGILMAVYLAKRFLDADWATH